MVAISVAIGGSALAAPDLRLGPDPASPAMLHDAMDLSASHDGEDGHDHGVKKACHCGLTSCSGWNLTSAAFELVDLDFAAARHDSYRDVAFLPHSPTPPLEPPRT
jgi:hypothetical protein